MNNVDLMKLYPNGREISKAKCNDLQQLIKHIPDNYHAFFKNLKFVENDSDYSLAIRQSDDGEEEEEEAL